MNLGLWNKYLWKIHSKKLPYTNQAKNAPTWNRTYVITGCAPFCGGENPLRRACRSALGEVAEGQKILRDRHRILLLVYWHFFREVNHEQQNHLTDLRLS